MKKLLSILLCSVLLLVSCSTGKAMEKEAVKSTLEIHEGRYFDSRVYTESSTLTTYYEVMVSNVTETSFDFTFYEVDRATNDKKIILDTNTAIFIEDGTKAVFYGEDQTFNFTFPDGHESHPVITDMQISGFDLFEGLNFFNNSIPGYEFG